MCHTSPSPRAWLTHTSRFRASEADTRGKKFCEKKQTFFFTTVSPGCYNSQLPPCEIIFLKNARMTWTNSPATDREHSTCYEIKTGNVSYDGFFTVAFDACALGHRVRRSSSKTPVRLKMTFLRAYGSNVVSDWFSERFTSVRVLGVSHRPALRWHCPRWRNPSRAIQQPVFRRFLL